MTSVVDRLPGTTVGAAPATASSPTASHRRSADVVALAVVAAVAPLDLGVPPNGWTPLFVRPLLLVVLAASATILVRQRRRVLDARGLLDAAVVSWLIVVWLSAAFSDDPMLGAAGAIRLTAFGLLVLATRAAVRTADDARTILRGLGAGVVGAGAVGLAVWTAGHEVLGTEHLVGSISWFGPHARLTRPWSTANVAGMAMAASLPSLLVLRPAWRLGAAAVVVPALLLTYSRGAAVAVAVGMLVVVAVRRMRADARWVVAGAAFVAVVMVAAPGWADRLADRGGTDWFGVELDVPEQVVLDADGTTATVTVSNRSAVSWSATGDDRVELVARWVGAGQAWSWGAQRWPLPDDLAPGESLVLTVPVDATVPDGAFDVRWDVERGDRVGFLEALRLTSESPGLVTASPIAAADVRPTRVVDPRRPLARTEIWSLAAGAFLDAPLLGVGPSELAAATADDVGPGRHVPGRHAHNLALESLATTGILGTAALAVVLGGAVWCAAGRAWRTRGRDVVGLAVLAGLTAVLVHGLVDHPLVYSSAAIPVAVLTGIGWTWRQRAVAR